MNSLIFQSNLVFNAFMLAFDLYFIRLVLGRSTRAHAAGWIWLAVLGLAFVPPIAALGNTVLFSLSRFSFLRFASMALFWHLPFVLVALAARIKSNASWILAVAAVGLTGIYIDAYHIEPFSLDVTRYELRLPGLENLSRPVVIAQLSDIQTDCSGPWERSVLEAVAAAKPDMVVYCGDYVQRWTLKETVSERARLRQIIKDVGYVPRYGSYAVPGDCEKIDFATHGWTEMFRGLPVETLEDESRVVELAGCQVNLIGLSAFSSRAKSESSIAQVLRHRKAGLTNLIIAHAPDFIDTLGAFKDPHLVLAGHCHGGQVCLPFLGPVMTLSRLPHRYADYCGPYDSGYLSVVRGIGVERVDAPRLRFLCRPELRLITLLPQQVPAIAHAGTKELPGHSPASGVD